MTYRVLSLRCSCGTPALRVREFGLTTKHQFVAHWRCLGCRNHVYMVADLDTLHQLCPTEADVAPQEPAKSDAQFLRDLGVRDPDDPGSSV